MRVSLAFSCLSALSLANAAYYSEGWKPGQPPPTRGLKAPSKQTSVPLGDLLSPKKPADAGPRKGIFDLIQDVQDLASEALTAPLKSGPVANLLEKAGLNVTQAIERAKAQAADSKWDPRIPLITDDNWEEIIEYEPLSPEEEDTRTWAILITLPQPTTVSTFVDEQFIKAFNETMDNGNDLPDVKWGRIDYMNVTMLTTKWIIWKAPVLVIATHRGQDLRFFQPTQIRMRDFHEILVHESWKTVQPWKTSWGPGGDKAWILHRLGAVFTKYNDITSKLPKWLIMLATGMIGSLVIQSLHGQNKKKETKAAPEPVKSEPAKPAVASRAAPRSPADAKKEASKKNRLAKRQVD